MNPPFLFIAIYPKSFITETCHTLESLTKKIQYHTKKDRKYIPIVKVLDLKGNLIDLTSLIQS